MKKAIFYVSICVVILAVIGILLYIQISNKVEKGIYIITTDSHFTLIALGLKPCTFSAEIL